VSGDRSFFDPGDEDHSVVCGYTCSRHPYDRCKMKCEVCGDESPNKYPYTWYRGSNGMRDYFRPVGFVTKLSSKTTATSPHPLEGATVEDVWCCVSCEPATQRMAHLALARLYAAIGRKIVL